MKYLKRTISLLLAILLLGTSVPGNVNEVLASESSKGDLAQTEENNSEESSGSQTAAEMDDLGDDSENTYEEILSEGLINYVYVESPYVEASAAQKVVVSFGDGTEAVSDALLCLEDANGIYYEMSLTKKEDNLYLFER